MPGLFGALASGAANLVRPLASLEDLTMEQWLYRLGGGAATVAGPSVSPESALRYTTVLICRRVLAEVVAQLPLILYRRRKDGQGGDRATDHPLYSVLHDLANGWNTSFEYREGQMDNLASRGNAFAYVERDTKGRTIGLVPLNPDPVTVTQARDWSPIYSAVMPDNQRVTLRPSQVHHIRGPLPRGYMGRSIITLAREGIGLGLAAQEFGSKLFSNGMNPSGAISHPKALGQEAQDRLREQVNTRLNSQEEGRKPLVLEEGMTWTALSITPEDGQFLETRKFQRAEIAGIFRVPLHLVNDLEKATFSNIEHQSLEFVIYSLMPWLARWEQAIWRDLLTVQERSEYYCEFLVDGLLRGDVKSRNEAYALRVQNGIENPNEIRAKDNLPPREGGDEYWKPSNMMGDQAAAQAIVSAITPGLRAAMARVFAEAA